MKLRSFLAFEIPEGVRQKLVLLIEDLGKREKGVKWVEPAKMHVTLHFFGSVEEELLLGKISDAIARASKGFGNIKLKCQGLGVFPNWKYPSVYWAGFTGETERALGLQQVLAEALTPFSQKEDKRAFRLHLTLGRATGKMKGGPLSELVAKLGDVEFGAVPVSEVTLFKSSLTKNGPVYTQLRGFSLE